MNLIIDIGNTRLKYGLFLEDNLLQWGNGESALFVLLNELCDERYDVFLSASGKIELNFMRRLKEYNREVVLFDRSMRLPLILDYDTPNTLGLDRIANCVGALTLGGSDLLVIDVGSAITYNYISGGNRFVGGNISLGVGMRFRALNSFTAHLPLLNADSHTESVGRSTETAIAAGVLEGVGYEVSGVINHYKSIHPEGKIIFTGGGYQEITNVLKKDYSYVKNLCLIGLNSIFRYNFDRG